MAYIYFDLTSTLWTIEEVIRSLLRQIVSSQSNLARETEDFYDEYMWRSTTADITALKKHLLYHLSRSPSSFVLFDALEEIPDATLPGVMQLIVDISKSGAKVFCTSDTVSVKSQVGDPLTVEIRAHDDDLLDYLSARLSKEWEYDDEFKRDILDTLVEKCSGKSIPIGSYLIVVSFWRDFNWTTF